jgi:hypothetical protein
MADEFSMILPVRIEHKIEILVPEVQPVRNDLGTVRLTADHAKTREEDSQAVAQNQETNETAALMGMWMGSLLLRDLAVEHLSGPADEELPQQPKRGTDERE